MSLNMILAVDEDGAIGKGGGIPWFIREDMRNFVRLTKGHTMVMGRKTWDSLPKKPLPGRHSIVLSSRPLDFTPEFCDTLAKLPSDTSVTAVPEIYLDPIVKARTESDDVWIIGGVGLYERYLPEIDRLVLTEVQGRFNGDAIFKTGDQIRAALQGNWTNLECTSGMENGLGYTITDMLRVDIT